MVDGSKRSLGESHQYSRLGAREGSGMGRVVPIPGWAYEETEDTLTEYTGRVFTVELCSRRQEKKDTPTEYTGRVFRVECC